MPELTDNDDLVEKVYQRLLNLITRPALLPAVSLNIVALAKELGVSRTPVRLAMERLRAEGLVQYHPDEGWMSIPVELDDLEEILELRAVLGAYRAQKAAQKITSEEATRLMDIIREMEQAAASRDLPQWISADQRYHAFLAQVAANKRLVRILQWVENQWYRTEAARMAMQGDMDVRTQQHRAIAEAICAQDTDAVLQAQQEHAQYGMRTMLHTLQTLILPYVRGHS